MNRAAPVFVVNAVRTPIGRGHPEKGQFRSVHANALLGTCFEAVIRRSGLDAEQVDDVIVGCVEQYGEQSLNIARNAWLQAGLPTSVPAMTVDRQCGSGQQAVTIAAALIASGTAELVVAGGVEHLGHVPMSLETALADRAGTPWPDALRRHHDLVPQGESAELLAARYGLDRDRLDALALESHRRAAIAQREGAFDREIVDVLVDGRAVTTDQGVRPNTDLEALGRLPPAFVSGGVVTAGNASQISDGASALLLAGAEAVDRLGLVPLARIAGSVSVGVDPVVMLEGPVPATRLLLTRAGLGVDDIDRFEVNEAFASVLGMWLDAFPVDADRVNVLGGAIALGHPLGASGARLVTSLVHQLAQHRLQRGVVTMCCRGGLGTATLVERAA